MGFGSAFSTAWSAATAGAKAAAADLATTAGDGAAWAAATTKTEVKAVADTVQTGVQQARTGVGDAVSDLQDWLHGQAQNVADAADKASKAYDDLKASFSAIMAVEPIQPCPLMKMTPSEAENHRVKNIVNNALGVVNQIGGAFISGGLEKALETTLGILRFNHEVNKNKIKNDGIVNKLEDLGINTAKEIITGEGGKILSNLFRLGGELTKDGLFEFSSGEIFKTSPLLYKTLSPLLSSPVTALAASKASAIGSVVDVAKLLANRALDPASAAKSSLGSAVAKAAVGGALKAATSSMIGGNAAALGAALGAPLGPIGMAAGGVLGFVGGVAGSMFSDKVIDKAIDKSWKALKLE